MTLSTNFGGSDSDPNMDNQPDAANLSARPFFGTARGRERAQGILDESRRLDDAVGKAMAQLTLDDLPRTLVGLLESLRKQSV